MGMFFLVRGTNRSARASAAAAICADMGFGRAVTLTFDDLILGLYPKHGESAANCVAFENGDFVFACGSCFFGGAGGTAALRQLYDRFSGDPDLLNEALGLFVIGIRKGGSLVVAGDR